MCLDPSAVALRCSSSIARLMAFSLRSVSSSAAWFFCSAALSFLADPFFSGTARPAMRHKSVWSARFTKPPSTSRCDDTSGHVADVSHKGTTAGYPTSGCSYDTSPISSLLQAASQYDSAAARSPSTSSRSSAPRTASAT